MSSILLPTIHCASAEEFLEALSPIGPFFLADPPDAPWLFRGQGRDYPLVPSAFRPFIFGKGGKLARLSQRTIATYADLLLAERDVLVRFFNLADRRGLVLPDDSQQLRSNLETLLSERGELFAGKGYQDWFAADSALSLTAMAQHYGVPTRLLDWARDVFVAAFFAAEGAVREIATGAKASEKMVVWSFFFPRLGKQDGIGTTDPVRIVTAPSASNPNLKAQQGVFTKASRYYTNEDTLHYLPLDQMLKELELKYASTNSDAWIQLQDCRLRKFTAPLSEGERLLRLLAKFDVTPSSVYPGYRSILDDMEMMATWS